MSNYIIIHGLKGKDRPRVNIITGTVYTPTTTKDYERNVRTAYRLQGGRNFRNQPVAIELIDYYQIPQSLSKGVKREMLDGIRPPMVKPDIDNILKIIMDALNGVAYDDDKQVVEVYTKKRYTDADAHVAFKVVRYDSTM